MAFLRPGRGCVKARQKNKEKRQHCHKTVTKKVNRGTARCGIVIVKLKQDLDFERIAW